METSKPKRRRTIESAFLNVPYDAAFADLFLAYIAGVSAFGLVPRATVEIPGGERRLDRVFSLLRTCRYSFHDLSRVELNREPPATPRFNTPFELGLAVGWAKLQPENNHTWFAFEAVNRRIHKSLSDLDGTDVYIHNGSVDGVLRELGNALLRSEQQPTFAQLKSIFADLKSACPTLMSNRGSPSVFTAAMFKDLVVLARKYCEIRIPATEP
jgi:hypothetical protein